MFFRADGSVLVVVDVQERLMPAIPESTRVLRNAVTLVRAARALGVPVLASEQYSKGLGPTVAALRALIPPEDVVEKITFSCAGEPVFLDRLHRLGRRRIVVAGTEAHVCVMQTVLSLVDLGFEVALVADAVASRTVENAELAIARMRAAGAVVVSTEMIVFEWMERAGTPEFKAVLPLVK